MVDLMVGPLEALMGDLMGGPLEALMVDPIITMGTMESVCMLMSGIVGHCNRVGVVTLRITPPLQVGGAYTYRLVLLLVV